MKFIKISQRVTKVVLLMNILAIFLVRASISNIGFFAGKCDLQDIMNMLENGARDYKERIESGCNPDPTPPPRSYRERDSISIKVSRLINQVRILKIKEDLKSKRKLYHLIRRTNDSTNASMTKMVISQNTSNHELHQLMEQNYALIWNISQSGSGCTPREIIVVNGYEGRPYEKADCFFYPDVEPEKIVEYGAELNIEENSFTTKKFLINMWHKDMSEREEKLKELNRPSGIKLSPVQKLEKIKNIMKIYISIVVIRLFICRNGHWPSAVNLAGKFIENYIETFRCNYETSLEDLQIYSPATGKLERAFIGKASLLLGSSIDLDIKRLELSITDLKRKLDNKNDYLLFEWLYKLDLSLITGIGWMNGEIKGLFGLLDIYNPPLDLNDIYTNEHFLYNIHSLIENFNIMAPIFCSLSKTYDAVWNDVIITRYDIFSDEKHLIIDYKDEWIFTTPTIFRKTVEPNDVSIEAIRACTAGQIDSLKKLPIIILNRIITNAIDEWHEDMKIFPKLQIV